MLIRKATLTFVFAAGTVLPAAGFAHAQQPDLDCRDFGSQAEAQAEFDRDPSDPHRLDADNDSLACEALDGTTTAPGAGPADETRVPGVTGQVGETPAGGVETGDGSVAAADSATAPIVLGLIGVGAAATATVVVVRRRIT